MALALGTSVPSAHAEDVLKIAAGQRGNWDTTIAEVGQAHTPISFKTATLGGSIEVPTLGGDVTIKVPHETQSGRVFRLREKGIRPVRGGATGDLFCRVVVETPVKLNKAQKALIEELRSSLGEVGNAQSAIRELTHPRGSLQLRTLGRAAGRTTGGQLAAHAGQDNCQ